MECGLNERFKVDRILCFILSIFCFLSVISGFLERDAKKGAK